MKWPKTRAKIDELVSLGLEAFAMRMFEAASEPDPPALPPPKRRRQKPVTVVDGEARELASDASVER